MVFVEESIRRQSRHRVLMPRAQWPSAASQRDQERAPGTEAALPKGSFLLPVLWARAQGKRTTA